MPLGLYPSSSLEPPPSTASRKSINLEQHQIRTEPQSQPPEDSDVEVSKEVLYAQQLQGVKGTESTSTKSFEG
jgi:hypothetical protein